MKANRNICGSLITIFPTLKTYFWIVSVDTSWVGKIVVIRIFPVEKYQCGGCEWYYLFCRLLCTRLWRNSGFLNYGASKYLNTIRERLIKEGLFLVEMTSYGNKTLPNTYPDLEPTSSLGCLRASLDTKTHKRINWWWHKIIQIVSSPRTGFKRKSLLFERTRFICQSLNKFQRLYPTLKAI